MLLAIDDAFAGIRFVQSNSKDSGPGITSDTLSFTSNNTAGNLIIVAVRRGGSSGSVTITDSQGNTYNQAVTQDRGVDHALFIFYAMNIKAGANTVTTTFGAPQTMRVAIHEYGGIVTTSALDKTSSDTNTSTSPNSGSQTTTQANELIFGTSSADDAPTYSVGTNFTLREKTGGDKIATEDKIVSAVGSYNATFSIGSDPWACAMATFRGTGTPIAWWKLDDGSGTSVADSSGNSYTGTLGDGTCAAGVATCPAWSSSGRYGSALSFDGANTYVNFGDIDALDGLTAVTVSFWIKSADSNSAASETHFVDKSDCHGNTNSGSWEFLAGGFTAHKPSFIVIPDGGVPSAYVAADGVTTIDDTQWHHLAGVYDGAKVYTYVDGKVDATATLSAITMASTGNLVQIGGDCNGHGGYIWNGLIDDVRIYNRALTPAEIRKLFQGGNAVRWSQD